ncbi:MAG TPA: helix-hairpin-helix domain-containing protein [Pyrinomonadaceae bacterium]|jgi:DNA polymerase (family 10)
MDNDRIAERFNRLANLMEIRGDDRYRIRSYRNAAEIIETWPTQMKKIADEAGAKGLQEIPGVGKAISAKIIELLTSGALEAWEKLTAETPATTLDLLKVSGIGLKTAATLHQQFKIASIDDLRKFVAGGGLEMVDGIGEKSAERIAESLKRF